MLRMDQRFVLVDTLELGDLIELGERALETLDALQPGDPLNACLRGAIAEVRCHSLLEPA